MCGLPLRFIFYNEYNITNLLISQVNDYKGDLIMRTYINSNAGRVLVIHLDRDDLLVESVEGRLAELGILNAVLVSSVGTLKRIRFHYITSTADIPVDEYKIMDGAFEVCSMDGLILDGKAHFHFVLSEPAGSITAGHVEDGCIVQNLMELVLFELPYVDLERRKNIYGIDYIAEKGEK